MKKLLLAFICFSYSGLVFAQLPFIHGCTVIPVNPTNTSPIKIVTHVSTPNASFHVDKTHSVVPVTGPINLHLCFGQNMPTVITHHVDTFLIGQLPPGVYPVQLRAYMSSAGQHCAKVDSNFTAITFTVTGQVGLKENTSENQVNIYPNPASDYFVVEPAGQKDIRIFSLQGQLVKIVQPSSTGRVSLEGLSSGMYFVEFSSEEQKDVRRLVIH